MAFFTLPASRRNTEIETIYRPHQQLLWRWREPRTLLSDALILALMHLYGSTTKAADKNIPTHRHQRIYAETSQTYPSSPCCERSSPWTSCSWVTRSPMVASTILRTMSVPTTASDEAISTPMHWLISW